MHGESWLKRLMTRGCNPSTWRQPKPAVELYSMWTCFTWLSSFHFSLAAHAKDSTSNTPPHLVPHSVNFLIPQWISALCINIVVYQAQAHIAGFHLVHHNTIIVNQEVFMIKLIFSCTWAGRTKKYYFSLRKFRVQHGLCDTSRTVGG